MGEDKEARIVAGVAALKTQFIRKLHIAFGVLLLITLSIAWYFFDSVNWYQRDLQQISGSNEVLASYQTLSDLTFRKLYAINDAVLRNNPNKEALSREDALELRMALRTLRQKVAEKAGYEAPDKTSHEMERLADIENALEQIISAGTSINLAMTGGHPEESRAELERLREEGAISRFSGLITQAITEQSGEVESAHTRALALASYVTGVLPVLMSIMVVITLAVVYLFSRSLRGSIGVLHEAVNEFASGNLKHRIPDIKEREFYELGQAFNTMARELLEHRTGLHDANVRLEAMIEERTRALTESNQKLAKVDENRRKLLADISHEFRTPLTVIKGESEIALRDQNKTTEDYRESLQRIIETADHTTRLVDDLLFIVRADAGEPRLEFRTVSVIGLVEKVCKDFEARALQKEVRIEMASQVRKAVMRGDAGRLRQVFGILLDNALRYSNVGGRIEVGIDTREDEVMVTVKDQGIGLTEEEAELAFKRFFRGRQAIGHARGTGLGLPVAKAIVEAHNGRITLEGKPGEGALATVYLPIEGSLRAVA